jgi:hypothetical protein
MRPDITIQEKYGPAMEIKDIVHANRYLGQCIEHTMERCGMTRGQARENEPTNLGYFAGYFNNETRARVERLFCCRHPFVGAISQVEALG